MKVYVVQVRQCNNNGFWRDELIAIRETKEEANEVADRVPNAWVGEFDTTEKELKAASLSN